MGTNYYHVTKGDCPTCGKDGHDVEKHIGKSSGGWNFSLHVYPEDGIHRLEDWIALWATGEIRNEYREVLTPDEMRKRITNRAPALLRHRIDGSHCIGHGEGAWDYIVGEFS